MPRAVPSLPTHGLPTHSEAPVRRVAAIRRLPPAEDLRWYLQDAEASSGLRSMHGAFVDMAQSGVSPSGRRDYETAVTDQRFGWSPSSSAGKARALRARFKALSPREQLVLWAAYGPHTWPVETRKQLGDLAGVATLTEYARAAHAGQVDKLVRMALAPGAKPGAMRLAQRAREAGVCGLVLEACRVGTADRLRQEALELVAAALRSWWGLAPSARAS